MSRKKKFDEDDIPVAEPPVEDLELVELAASSAIEEPVASGAASKQELPAEIRKLLEDIRDKGVAYVGPSKLRLLEPYGWNGATGPELRTWAASRLSS